VKILRRVLLALLFSLLLGLVIGTVLRIRLERPIHYIGSAMPAHPLDISDSRASVFDPCHYEAQIG